MESEGIVEISHRHDPNVSAIRRRLESAFLRAVRLYTFNTPIAKGKYRAFMFARGLCKSIPRPSVVSTRDGRRLWIDLSTGMHDTVFFLGEYERAITDLAAPMVKEGNTCLDVGANFGWYTTLFRKLAGDTGSVHAFEPVPPSFDELRRNLDLMGNPPNVRINNLALGDHTGELTINLFSGLTTGHASLSDGGRSDATVFSCRVVTLDRYIDENEIGGIDFVKVDIEGAELQFLRGADTLFSQERPPVILMEMALNTTRNFGYYPDDLVKFIGRRAAYEFYIIDEIRRRLVPIEGFAPDDIGANVICFPEARPELKDLLVGWTVR